MGKPTWDEIKEVTCAMAIELARLGLRAVLIGSIACKYYSPTRKGPGDVDLVLLQPCNSEQVKKEIADNHDRITRKFTLYHRGRSFLLYHLDGNRTCKIDLIPRRTKNIPMPRLLKSELVFPPEFGGVAVMPVIALLLLKVHGWWGRGNLMNKIREMRDRGASKRVLGCLFEQLGRSTKKRPADLKDIDMLLSLVSGLSVDAKERWVWRNESFVKKMKYSVGKYTDKDPESEEFWDDLLWAPLRPYPRRSA